MEGKRELVSSKLLLQILMISMLLLLCVNLFKISRVYYFRLSTLQNFSTIFLSIILEGLPFIIIGALISSLIQVFVSEDMIARIIPRNSIVGLLLAAVIGLIFPVCECAIVPIARRLIKKGVPVGMAVTFMLAVPIVNPVVLASTYYAFLGQPMMVIYRAGFGIVSALAIGYLIGELHQGTVFKKELPVLRKGHIHIHDDSGKCSCGHIHSHVNIHNHGHGHEHNHEHNHEHEHGGGYGIISEVVSHTSVELYDIGKYFILGALLSAAMQTFVPRSYILSVGGNNLTSILVMMAMAFLLSICSETDAFIARTFAGQFTSGSIIAFLIFGPMIDVKNTMMLSGSFKISFVVKLILLIFAICFMASVIFNLTGITI